MPDDERQGDIPDPQIDAVAERIALRIYNPQTLPYVGAVLGVRAVLQGARQGDPQILEALRVDAGQQPD